MTIELLALVRMSIKSVKKESDKAMDADQEARAWRVAQLAAQLAGVDVLRHGTKPDFQERVPEEERANRVLPPNSDKLDWWFLGLLDRADWLLKKSEGMHTGPWLFADFFEGGQTYSYNKIADEMRTYGITGWGRSSVSGKVKEMADLMLERCSIKVAQDVLWLSMAEKGPMPLDVNVDEDMIKCIKRVLAGSYDTVGELFDAVVEEAVCQCGVIQGVDQAGESGKDGKLYYHDQAGSDVKKVSLLPRSMVEAHSLSEEWELPVDEKILQPVRMWFQFNQALGRFFEEETGSGGEQKSKGIWAADMFCLASKAGLPEEFWSHPRE